MNRVCPVCKKEDIQPTHASGFWEKRILPLALLQPYRCRMCRSRFYRFSLQDGMGNLTRVKRRKKAEEKQQFQQFLKPPDKKEFRELIAEIAEAERRMFDEQPADHLAGHADEPTDNADEES